MLLSAQVPCYDWMNGCGFHWKCISKAGTNIVWSSSAPEEIRLRGGKQYWISFLFNVLVEPCANKLSMILEVFSGGRRCGAIPFHFNIDGYPGELLTFSSSTILPDYGGTGVDTKIMLTLSSPSAICIELAQFSVAEL